MVRAKWACSLRFFLVEMSGLLTKAASVMSADLVLISFYGRASCRESVFGSFERCTGLYWTMLVRLRQQITNLAMLSKCFKKWPD